MRHGTTVRVLTDGPQISQSRLKTIGIYHESISWAAWVASGDQELSHTPDLLISAINPLSWPYTFRLSIRLKNDVGSMALAAEKLRTLGVNILSARSSVSGHHHATWNLIGEALPLRERFEKLGWNFLGGPDPDNRDKVAARIAQQLLRFLDSLLKEIDGAGFLHTRFIANPLMSFRVGRQIPRKVWSDQELWSRIGDQRSRAVSCSVLPVLTFLWRQGVTNLKEAGRKARDPRTGRGLPPLEFQYDRNREILLSRGPRLGDDLEYLGIGVPGVAVASFDTDEHFLRLRFFKEEERRKLYHIDIEYYQHFAGERSTRGLIEFVTRRIADRGINLVQVSNSVSTQSPVEESGGLRFIVELPEEPQGEEIAELKLSLATALVDRFEGFAAKKIDIFLMSVGRVFLSRNEDLANEDPLRIIDVTAQEIGLEVIEARTMSSGVTENTVRELRSCQGLVQVYGNRERGPQNEVQWLIGEYAAAVALGLPALRIVDLAVMEENAWKRFLRWDQDQHLITYDSGLNEEKIRAQLEDPLRRFLQVVRFRQALPRAAG